MGNVQRGFILKMYAGSTIHGNDMALGSVDLQTIVFRTTFHMFHKFIQTSWRRGKKNNVVGVEDGVEVNPWDP